MALTGRHSSRQNWTLTWNLTTWSSENLKASNFPWRLLELGIGWRDGKMAGSAGHPRSSSNTMESLLSPLRATRFRAKIPYTPEGRIYAEGHLRFKEGCPTARSCRSLDRYKGVLGSWRTLKTDTRMSYDAMGSCRILDWYKSVLECCRKLKDTWDWYKDVLRWSGKL